MKLDLQPIIVEKAIEALQTMFEQTGRISYEVAREAMQKELQDAREKASKVETPSLFG